MSRFAEGAGDEMDEREEREFLRDIAIAYKSAVADLEGFLAYLDAMPVKRIIASRFMDPKTGEKCAVAAFCDFKSVPKLEMLKTEGLSYAERLENGDGERNELGDPVGSEENDGFEGATVAAGERAGLPHLVAYNLAWNNDMNWTTVKEADPVPCDERCEFIEHPGTGMPMRRGSRFGLCQTGHVFFRPMTPEERWKQLRDHVAWRITQAAKEIPPLPPDCTHCGDGIDLDESGSPKTCNICGKTGLCVVCIEADEHSCKAVTA